LPDEVRLVGALVVSFGAVLGLTPLAIRIASRTGFYDHPRGYKAHRAPTAYLGGAAVISGFALSALLFTGDAVHYLPLIGAAAGLWALGTVDDRVTVRPRNKILAEVAAAFVLWASGLGWTFPSSGFEELLLTTVWVVAFTNSFNLMDNMDGVAGTVGAACAAGVAGLALAQGDAALAALTLALAGSCLGFLPYNLRPGGRPARIFLGDGGSLPLGFILAGATMQIPMPGDLGWAALLAGGLLLGILVLDTLLVIVSRTRRGVSLMTGGRDHLSHRLRSRLGSPWAVAIALAATQAGVSTLAIVAVESGQTAVIMVATTCLAAGAGAIALLEKPGWAVAARPPRETLAETATDPWWTGDVAQGKMATPSEGASGALGHSGME
jgi:UDP-GlcNAc:undecaprenyl-phosphate/decaprenyl-phosphate GlcNAc-1-phosphate transferase